MRDLGEKVSASDRARLEAQVNTLKEAMLGEDAGRMRTKIAELQQAMMALGQAPYRGLATEPGSNGDAKSRTEDVIEGNYQEI
jgi:molecular chaperone DnaK